MSSNHFHILIEKCKEIHDKKSHDYASDSNPFSNFEQAASVANVTTHEVFKVLIGIKLARLSELLTNNKDPKNESIEDTFIDLANYCLLWGSYYAERRIENDVVEVSAKASPFVCNYCNIIYNDRKPIPGSKLESKFLFCRLEHRDAFEWTSLKEDKR